MKKITSAILIISMLLCGVILSSCEEGFEEFTYNDGRIVSEDDGRAYIPAQIGFQPCGVGEKCALRDGAFDLYEVLDADGNAVSTDDWLTEEYAGAATSVYYREGITLPAYYEIDYDECYLCEEKSTYIKFATIDDKELIDTLIGKAAGGASAVILDDPTASYTLKFHSKDYPAILYSVDYLVFEDGAYLFNRTDRTYADVAGLLDDYIGPAEAETQ